MDMFEVTIDEINMDLFLERVLSNVIEHRGTNRILQIRGSVFGRPDKV
jgi:hypothetical protein